MPLPGCFLDVPYALSYNTDWLGPIRSNAVQVTSDLAKFNPDRGTLLTIGVFDGVHLGHRQLIDRVTRDAAARHLISGVVTFTHHPKAVLSPKAKLARLTTLQERSDLLRRLGVELVVPLTFTSEFAKQGARDFIVLLQQHLRMQGLVIGPDFALGRGRQGDENALRALGEELGFTVEVVSPLVLEGTPVSSTAIRGALAGGDMETASKLLGRHFRLSGPVVGGTERGHTIGFPTANLGIEADQALPSDGVYATLAHADEKVYPSVTNIGVRPTFDGGERTVEVFLMDFDQDIYGHEMSIDLVARLRGEAKFESVEDLSRQIAADVREARELLAHVGAKG